MPVLKSGMVWFYTSDENKDGDTFINVKIFLQDGKTIAAEYDGTDMHEEFKDYSYSSAQKFSFINDNIEKNDIFSGKFKIVISPNGNDTWAFAPFLRFIFSDGTSISGRYHDSFTLNESHKSETCDMSMFDLYED